MGTGSLFLNDHVADLTDAQLDEMLSVLPAWRREAALRFKFRQGRLECAAAYIELLRALRLTYGIEDKPDFAFNEHGKPFLPSHPDIHFSLSHCREAVGCLISDRPCGLDIERLRQANDSLIRYTMNDEEVALIEAAPLPDLAFTRLWTQKEAVFKLFGTGITDDVRNILVPSNLQHITLTTIDNPWRGYVLTMTMAS